MTDEEFDVLNDERIELLKKEFSKEPYDKARLAQINTAMDEYFRPYHEAAVAVIQEMMDDLKKRAIENERLLDELGVKSLR